MAEFSQELFDEICGRISDGDSLRKICSDEDMPSQVTIFRWLKESDSLSKQYARAREAQADALFDECVYIADTAEDAQLARLRIDTRKWTAGKLKPKKYGEKITAEVEAGDKLTDMMMEIAARSGRVGVTND